MGARRRKTCPWYGFKESQVNQIFTGGLTYVNTFCLSGESVPEAVYRVAEPDREKGYKDFLLLSLFNGIVKKSLIVRGVDLVEMRTQCTQPGVECAICNELLYSRARHDYHSCKCGTTSIDGGRDYLKYSFHRELEPRRVFIDLLTGKEA